jgi:hypothetical protein
VKSVKKRFRLLLKEIHASASVIAFISADLTLLNEVHSLAEKVLSLEKILNLQAAEIKKTEFIQTIIDSEALHELEEIIDIDIISQLEARFFDGLDNHAENEIGDFLQQLLQKIEKPYHSMLDDIQNLIALLDEEPEL